jgi:hypothetical protein
MVDYSGHFAGYGQGSYLRNLPPRDAIHFLNFAGGYFSAVNRKEVPDNTSPFALDVEVTNGNRLRRSPGTTLLESFATRTPNKFIVHGSLDFTSELVFFDPPFLGVKRLAATVWEDKSFVSDGWWAWTNFGGTLIFSDGDAVYARQVNDGTTISTVAEAPVAVTYESWAGRVWAGGAIIDANFEQLGLVWSAANSDYTDWTGTGSGFELLLDAISQGDRIIRLKSMNLDFMAVLLRNSIWIVRRTANVDRPGDPQPRVAGKGAINHDVVQSTEKGIVTLTDNGVELFDGNTCTHLSDAIDADLLPLDYGAILEYSSGYDTIRNRYYLHVPNGTTWILDLNKGRWYRRSLNAIASVMWPEQTEDAIVEGAPRMVFLGDQMDEELTPRAIAYEDQDSFDYFGVPMTPIWTTKPRANARISDLLTTKQFNMEYTGEGTIELWSPNNHGEYELLIEEILIPQPELEVVDIYAGKTGRLASIMLRISDGDIEVSDLQAIVMARGPRVAIGEGGEIGEFPDRTTILDFPEGTPWTMQYGPNGPPAPSFSDFLLVLIGVWTYRLEVTIGAGAITPDEYVVDWGDGTVESYTPEEFEDGPEHTYAAAGTYDGSIALMYEGWVWTNYDWRRIVTPEEEEGPDVMPETYFMDNEDANTQVSTADLIDLTHPAFPARWDTAHGLAPSGGWDSALVPTVQLSLSDNVDPDLDNQTYVMIRRAIMRFDTSLLTGTVVGGRVRLKAYTAAGLAASAYSGEPGSITFLAGQSLALGTVARVDPDVALSQRDNFLEAGTTVLASDDTVPLAGVPDGVVMEFELNAAGLAEINAGGFTNLTLRILADLNDAVPAFPGGFNINHTAVAYFYHPFDAALPGYAAPELELDVQQP